MADRDAQPGDEARHAREVQQPDVDDLGTGQIGGKAQRRHHGGGQQRVDRHAAGGDTREDARRHAPAGQRVEHAGGGIHAGVAGREHRGEHDGIHQRRSRQQAGPLEHQRERTDADIAHLVAQQARVGIGDEQADDEDGQDVEEQDPPEDLPHGARDVSARIGRFTRSDADQLGALEGEADDHRHTDEGGKAPRKRRLADRPVGQVLGEGMGALAAMQDADDHHQAHGDEDDDGDDLDGGEPVLGLAKALHRNDVQQEHDAKEERAPEHARHLGHPVAHDQLGRHQVHRDGNGPVVPVVPAQREAEAFIHITGAIGGKRAGDRHVGGQFAQAGHQEVDHQADEAVGQQRPAGAGLRDGGPRGHEQTGADGAADGDHRQVARLERAAQPVAGRWGGRRGLARR